jgi:hypothetical protein
MTDDSKPVAEKLGKVSEGYGVWFSLHGHKSPGFLDFLNKTQLLVNGNDVKVPLQEPVDALVAQKRDLCKSLREHVKMHAAMMERHCRMMQGEREKTMKEMREEMLEKMGKKPGMAPSDNDVQ